MIVKKVLLTAVTKLFQNKDQRAVAHMKKYKIFVLNPERVKALLRYM